jgi:hypothetical protein
VRRLSDGALALFAADGSATVRTLVDEDLAHEVPREQRDALVKLARGVPDGAALGELFDALRARGLADDGLDDDDPVVLARLRELGAGLSWRLDDDTRAVCDDLRRAHARRKSTFLDFWQGPCVPECGARRVRELTRALPVGARVFLVGDDDLLTLPLARAGFRVTTIDIDDALIALLNALADEQGLDVDARVLDLCEPLPAELRGAFDAALTDPQSSPAPMRAFVSRALAAVREGGKLFVSVHDQFRSGFAALCEELPVRGLGAHLGFGAYYTHGWEADPYRSDFLVLERNSGALPFAPDEWIDSEVFLEGHEGGDHHGLCAARVMSLRRGPWLDVDRLAADLEQSERPALRDVDVVAGERFAALVASRADGGHLVVSCDFPRKRLSYALAPLREGEEETLVRHLEDQVRMVRQHELRGVPPHVGAPVYDV